MKRTGLWLIPLVFFAACATRLPQSDTYYVHAGGSDRNNGLSEETAFRSLFKAAVMAARGPVKTITVLGTLDESSEQSSNVERVFLIQGTDAPKKRFGRRPSPASGQIVIRGKSGVLSASGSGRRAVLIRGTVDIRFEDIEISGGSSAGEGGGLGIGPGASVTLGPGTVIRNNNSGHFGGGAVVAPGGTLYVDGARITDNRAAVSGGGIAAAGNHSRLFIRNGEISGNHAQAGGGIAVYQGSACVLSGGAVRDNTADLAGGGIVVSQGAFTMEEGFIRGNTTSGSGGGAAILEKSSMVLKGGEISGNRSAEHGGGMGADESSDIAVEGGTVFANRAVSWGGGIFTAGPFVKTGGTIAGRDASEDDANVSASGAAVYVFQGEESKVRNNSAGENLGLDASAEDGWTKEKPDLPAGMD